MKVLVTGGAGFIGSHVVEYLLKEDCDVIVLDNLSTGCKETVPESVKIIKMDICSPALTDLMEQERFDSVIHLAAQTMVPVSIDNPEFDCRVNVLGSVNLLEACRKTGVKRIIFSSSAAVYGNNETCSIREDSKTEPTSFYGLSKLTVENYIQLYSQLYGLEYFILRYSNVYGERQGDRGEGGVISIFCNRIRTDQMLIINGDGGQTRDFVYVEDVAIANWKALTAPNANEVLNVSTNTETSVNELIALLGSLCGKIIEKKHGPVREGDIYRSTLANSKVIRSLGWQPSVALREGLKKTYEYFSNL